MEAKIGTMGWLDLTVDNAEGLRAFYSEVLGWEASPVSMGEGSYNDYAMLVDGKPVGGICHRRGENSQQPAVWMPYFVVADLSAAIISAEAQGGHLHEQRGKMAVMRDPAGVYFALWQG